MLTVTLALAIGFWGASPVSLADLFEPCDYHYGEKQEHLLKCRLFTPCNLNSAKQYPMLVWLFHKGDVGSEYLNFAFPDLASQTEKYPLFILTIQWPTMDSDWFRSVGANNIYDADAALISQVVQKTVRENPVDERRVFVTGESLGGSRCWFVAANYPELFSAVAPLGAGGGNVKLAANLAKVPIWAFHNANDTYLPPDGDERTVAAVAAIGGNVRLSLLPADGHDCWTAAFQKHHIFAWMLAQRREAPCWTPPGSLPWQWWHILALPCGLLVIVRLAWYVEQRRRSRVTPKVDSSVLEADDDFAIGPIQPEYDPSSTEALFSQGATP